MKSYGWSPDLRGSVFSGEEALRAAHTGEPLPHLHLHRATTRAHSKVGTRQEKEPEKTCLVSTLIFQPLKP